MLKRLMLALVMASAAVLCTATRAEDFPNHPVRIMVPWAPAATPREIINKPAELVARAAHSPDVRQRLLDQGAEPIGSTPEEFSRQLHAEVGTWAEVVKLSGAKVDE